VIVDSQACLLTYELRELAAGLKVLRAGVKDEYESGFVEDAYFSLFAQSDGGECGFVLDVSLRPAQHHWRTWTPPSWSAP
jgi:hypothetical protein